ncbi:MAG: hypothetical protein ACYCZT_08910 [Thiobacillus sp.]
METSTNTLHRFLPNLLRGAGMVLTVKPVRVEQERLFKPAASAQQAMKGDLKKIGGDLYAAIAKIKRD